MLGSEHQIEPYAGISGKLPGVAALQAEYAKLQEQREGLYADYGKLKKQVGEYVIKRNIDIILRQDREPEWDKKSFICHCFLDKKIAVKGKAPQSWQAVAQRLGAIRSCKGEIA